MGNLLFIVCTGLILAFVFVRFFERGRKARTGKARAHAAPVQPAPVVFQPQASVIPEDTSSLEQKMRLEEERDFLFRLNEKMGLSSDSKTIAATIVTEVRSFLNLEVSSLYLYDMETGELKAEAVAGVDEKAFAPQTLKKGESITGEVARTRQPILVNDLASNAFYGTLNAEPCFRNSCLSFPVIFQEELIGVVNCSNKKSGAPFRESDQKFMTNVARIGALAFKNSRLLAQMNKDYLNTITTLALLIDARDAYTKRHSENVTKYAVAIAREIKLSVEQVELISRAGLLHDIGKIGIRDDVLLKPGKLTDEEFGIIKSHAARGAEIVATLPAFASISFLVRHHHERYDGKGYPDGKKGEEIELGARILAIADTFDAMTTDRPYRKALTLQEATAEVARCRGTQFDPALADSFLRVLEKDPGLLNNANGNGQVPSPARPARSIP